MTFYPFLILYQIFAKFGVLNMFGFWQFNKKRTQKLISSITSKLDFKIKWKIGQSVKLQFIIQNCFSLMEFTKNILTTKRRTNLNAKMAVFSIVLINAELNEQYLNTCSLLFFIMAQTKWHFDHELWHDVQLINQQYFSIKLLSYGKYLLIIYRSVMIMITCEPT